MTQEPSPENGARKWQLGLPPHVHCATPGKTSQEAIRQAGQSVKSDESEQCQSCVKGLLPREQIRPERLSHGQVQEQAENLRERAVSEPQVKVLVVSEIEA